MSSPYLKKEYESRADLTPYDDGETPGMLASGLQFSQGEKPTVSSVGWKNLSITPGSAYGISGLELTEPALDKWPT